MVPMKIEGHERNGKELAVLGTTHAKYTSYNTNTAIAIELDIVLHLISII